VVPVIAAAITIDHHAMVIWATADAVLTSIIALVVGRGKVLSSSDVGGGQIFGSFWDGNSS
jgi:hypothetical protein